MRDPRPWTYAALFGTLWGAAELTLGTALSLSRFPLYGMLMTLLGLFCLVCLRRLQPRVGVCVLAGAVAVFLKMFTIGGLYPGPLIGIAGEALLVELAFIITLSRQPGAILGGALAMVAPPVEMALMARLVAGPEAVAGYLSAARSVLGLIGLGHASAGEILGWFVGVAAVAGACAGHLAWRVSGRVIRRLGGHP